MNKVLLLIFLVFLAAVAPAQQTVGFSLPKNQKKITFDFEIYNNLIAIPVTINKFLSVKFIVDTGAEATILTEKAFGDLVGLSYVRTIHISGPGIIDSIEAHVATDVDIELPKGIKGTRMAMLVLKKDYLELKENLGDEIYGIIGYDIFNRFVVEIDYDDLKITLHDPKRFKPKKYLDVVDITLKDTKPYVLSALQQKGMADTVKLMVDTGASHALLLDVYNTDDLTIPEKTITARLGQGLGGEIPGMIGRLSRYQIGNFAFENILVSIPFEGVYSDAIKRGSRHGTLGGELLSRFNPTFDYFSGKLYISRGKRYSKKFEFDMSGLTLAVDDDLKNLMIKKVQPDTPAYAAGLEPGDQILNINGLNLTNAKLSEINLLLRKRNNFKIKVRFLRNGVAMFKEFRLTRMI